MKKIILILIKFYQKTFSPDHGLFSYLWPGGFCKFYPSCSEYAYQAIKRQGTARGLVKGVWRILRCNPFSQGGIDLVNPVRNQRFLNVVNNDNKNK